MLELSLSIIMIVLVLWLVRRWLYVRVSELETAVVYHANGSTFARFLAPGRHWITPFAERIGAAIPLSPSMAKGRCIAAETGSGVPLTIEWSLTYKLDPFRIAADKRPKLARTLPLKSRNIARNHINHCIRHVIGAYTAAKVSQPGMLKRLEREIRQQAMARLAPLGFELSRVMLGAIEMPPSVRASLAEAYEQKVRIEYEAQSLARLHQVVSQFSERDMARLLELERIYKLGQNGVTMLYQTTAVPAPPTPPTTINFGRRYPRPSQVHMTPPDATVSGLS